MNGGPLDEFGLTLKQRKFCLAYVGAANGNGTEACRIAGYEGSDDTLKSQACENLTKPYLISAIEQLRAESEAELCGKITERHMDAAEVRSNLSLLARTAEKHSDRIRATELMGKILGEFPNKVEISSKELEDAIARAASQYPGQVPLPPTFGQDKEEGPAS
jgi:hypothetical protein